MSRSKIEWVKNQDGSQGYSLNPIKGKCPVACPYCYARRLYDRFKWNPEIRYDDDWLLGSVKYIPDGSRIFMGSTMELFGEWIQKEWLETIFQYCKTHPLKTFIFLTKCPENLKKWSPFPSNAWVGATATDARSCLSAFRGLEGIQAKVKFVSFEPLLDYIGGLWLEDWLKSGIAQWAIIGAQTQPFKPPREEWVEEIVQAADKSGLPVFLKCNLIGYFPIREPFFKSDGTGWKMRQEFPKGEGG